jgi:hypothetical protein
MSNKNLPEVKGGLSLRLATSPPRKYGSRDVLQPFGSPRLIAKIVLPLPFRLVHTIFHIRIKIKVSLCRPWRLLGLPEVEAPTFSDSRLTDGGKVVSLTRRPPFNTPQENSWYSFLLEAESTPGPP